MNLSEYKHCLNLITETDLSTLQQAVQSHEHIILLGNGGSNAISCHIAQDYTKVLRKRALCFGDSSRLSCYANDYGWSRAYREFLVQFADPATLVILLSSSGNSENILQCADLCLGRHDLITLSGFAPDNRLRTQYSASSLVHFYVPSYDYGVVECLHELILHSVI